MDFGCRRYGGQPFSGKIILILEEEPYRYQAAISDLAGNDIEAHGGDYLTAVRKVRNWFAGLNGFQPVGAANILAESMKIRWVDEGKNGITSGSSMR